jgi:hypothetical protein
MQKKIAISCTGDEHFRHKLQLLSLRTGKQIGDLVRTAIDEKYGAELDALNASFFAKECADVHILNEDDQRESA